jgi:hypothetical protein
LLAWSKTTTNCTSNCTTSYNPIFDTFASNSSHLYVAAGSVAAGSYVVALTVFSATDAWYRSRVLVPLHVTAAPLLAVIAGGGRRSVWQEERFVLSSRGSRDLALAAHLSQGLRYGWRCSMSSMECRDKTNMPLDLATTTSHLVIPAGRLPASRIPYEFSLAVSKDARFARTSVFVYVSEHSIPEIELEHTITTRDTQGRVKINCFSQTRLLVQALASSRYF